MWPYSNTVRGRTEPTRPREQAGSVGAMNALPFDLDQRSRSVDDIVGVDAAVFHAVEVPRLLAERGALATRALVASGRDAFTLAVDGAAWTWRLDGSGALEVVDGDDGHAPRADLSTAWFSDIVNNVGTAVSLMIAGLPVMERGKVEHLILWEPVLRALVDGRQPYEPGAVDFVDLEGAPLDLHHSFTLDDDPAEVRHFLGQAGFLHIRSVFDDAEMEELSSVMDGWLDQMTPEDSRSWYATVGDRRECVRVTNLGRNDVAFPHADRLAPIADIAGGDRVYGGSDLLVKPVGVTEGLSDLPWHKDCELGGHTFTCASLTCGASVTPSGADNGQLGIVAGSHRVNVTMLDIGRIDLPQVFLTTERGDVTVHLSCALHCATPPLHSERRVTYSDFRLPGDSRELDARLAAARDQAGRDTYAPT